MARYLLKRIWGPANEAEMLENALRSKRVRDETFLDITWDHSHVVADDEGRVISYCIYEAQSEERVLEHASATGGHFVDHVLPLTDDVEGPGPPVGGAGAASPRYLLVQRWAEGVSGEQLGADLREANARGAEVRWEHSHLGPDNRGRVVSHGVYGASDDAVVRRHATNMANSEITELFEIGGDVNPADLVG